MAEFLVLIASRVDAADPYKDVKLHKRGDVIEIVPDGWVWSAAEKTNPNWRIVKWPGVLVADVTDFMQPELDNRTVKMGSDPMLQIRGFNLNIDIATLPVAVKAFIADSTRAQRSITVPAQITVAALKAKKAKRPDPNVIA